MYEKLIKIKPNNIYAYNNLGLVYKKLNKDTKALSFFLAIIYGSFIVISLQLQFFLGSGDINSYIHFFDEAGNDASVVTIRGDYAFRIAVFWLTEFFDITTISVLSYMAFAISSVIFYLYSIK